MISKKYEIVDRKVDKIADFASVLAHPIRKQIRDLLRTSEPLTLTEIARLLNCSEPHIYQHLTTMTKAGILKKEYAKLRGYRVTLYSLSEEYNKIFDEYDNKIDLTPIYVLSGLYSILMVLSLVLPSHMLKIYNMIGITTIAEMITVNFVGLITTLIILVCYAIPEIEHANVVESIKSKIKRT